MFLHEQTDFKTLVEIVSREKGIDPSLIEKDYWIMHCLYGLQQMKDLRFELKGGTSLSKGFGIIHRFSEDIDIHIQEPTTLRVGKNHNKPKDVEARAEFFERITADISIPGLPEVKRDMAFDDAKLKSAGIRLNYEALYPVPKGVKVGVLLEAGFAKVTPNRECDITSWVYEHAVKSGLTGIIDNRALAVKCYEPGYTLVEKIQAISKKYRQQQEQGTMPQNFIRHYYDVYCLLADESVQAFIGTGQYNEHKDETFTTNDIKDLTDNPAFHLNEAGMKDLYEKSYDGIASLFYHEKPTFSEILAKIETHISSLLGHSRLRQYELHLPHWPAPDSSGTNLLHGLYIFGVLLPRSFSTSFIL